jgi:hypothetical protein
MLEQQYGRPGKPFGSIERAFTIKITDGDISQNGNAFSMAAHATLKTLFPYAATASNN